MNEKSEVEFFGDDADIPRIAPDTPTNLLLTGSHNHRVEVVAARVLPSGEIPLPRPPMPVPVSVPDVALQFVAPGGLDLKTFLLQALHAKFGSDADIRYSSVNGRGTVGLWMLPSTSNAVSGMRDRGLNRVDILYKDETFALFVNSSLIRGMVQEAWNKMPQRLGGDGREDPQGPVHLTGMSVSIDTLNNVRTIIKGFDERPWPDVDFNLTIRDGLSVSGGCVQIRTDRTLDVDQWWLHFLSSLFTVVLPPLGGIFLAEDVFISSLPPPSSNSGAGGYVALFSPDEILLAGGMKISAYYSRINTSSGGVFVGGSASPSPRTPSVAIQGQVRIAVEEDTALPEQQYRIVVDDLRGPLRIQWSGEGAITSPDALLTYVHFDTAGARGGQVLKKRLGVRVTDSDGLSAGQDIDVHIHVTKAAPEIPPICRKKPWLPGCL